jgi:hypothetical protein
MTAFLLRLRAALREENLQVLVLFLIGLILRCYCIDTTPFWYDESFTALMVQLPVGQLLNATAGDVHPPFYYLLLSAWGQLFGFTPAGLRELSALFSILSLWQIEQLCKLYKLERKVKLTVLALAVFSPVLIYYGQEARMYALLQFLVLAVWIAVLKRQWILIGVATTAMLYTHNYGMIYAACLGLMALGMAAQKPRFRYEYGTPEWEGTDVPYVLASFGLPLLLYVPWFAYGLLSQFGKMGAEHWLSHVSFWGQVLGTTSLLMGTKAPSQVNVLLFVVTIGLALPVLWSTLKARRLGWLLMLLGPIGLAVLISLWKTVYLTRALTPILPAAYLIIATALWKSKWYEQLVPKAAFFACIAIGLLAVIGSTAIGTAKYNPLTAQNDAFLKRGVPVVHIGDFTAVNWMASRPGTQNYLYLSECPALPGELEPRTRAAMGVPTLTAAQLPAEYYLVSYVGNLSNKCQEDQYARMTASLRVVQVNQLEWGQSGVYYHASR